MPYIFATVIYHLRRGQGFDYAGSISAIDATTKQRAESRSPGRLERSDPVAFERRFEATTDPLERLRIVREAAAELARYGNPPPPEPDAPGYLAKAPGRPCSVASGHVLERAAGASNLTAAELRATVGRGRRRPHPALVSASLAEIAAGRTFAAVAREIGVSERTLRRWQEMSAEVAA